MKQVIPAKCSTPPKGAAMRKRKQSHVGVQFVFALLGMATAYWLASSVLPKVVVHTDEKGQWQSIHLDWSAKLLDVHRR